MERINFPSGIRLPAILQQRIEEQIALSGGGECRIEQPAYLTEGDDDGVDEDLQGRRRSTKAAAVAAARESSTGRSDYYRSLPEQIQDRVFTVEELEERIWRTSVALVDLQKQIYRGEEAYYEETAPRGNIFRGWDAFIDARDPTASSASGIGGSGSGSHHHQSSGGHHQHHSYHGGGSRRVPSDCRWFSGSCRSVSRNAKPAPLCTRMVSSSSVSLGIATGGTITPKSLSSSRMNTPTPMSISSVVSTTTTPPRSQATTPVHNTTKMTTTNTTANNTETTVSSNKPNFKSSSTAATLTITTTSGDAQQKRSRNNDDAKGAGQAAVSKGGDLDQGVVVPRKKMKLAQSKSYTFDNVDDPVA